MAPSNGVDYEVKERAMDEAPIGITITDPDRPDNPLVYVNESFERLTGYPKDGVLGRNCRFLQGPESDPDAVARLREGIAAKEPVTVEIRNYRRDGTPFWNEVTVAPLRDEDDRVTHYVGFQVDVTARKEAQLALDAERARLDRLVDRINGVLADVTDLLMQGIDRHETEQTIVERITATDAYAAAWIGKPDLARAVLAESAAAGFDEAAPALTVDLAADSPAARAYHDGQVVVGDGAELPLAEGTEGQVAAIPLVYGDATYGVLAVVGADVDALDDRELVVLESVGRTIATAINAAQSRRGLTADDLLELEFAVADPAFFPVAIAAAIDGRLEFRGSTTSERGGLRVFFDTQDGSIESVPTPPLEDVATVVTIPTTDAALLEVELEAGSIIEKFAEWGAEVRSLTADPDQAELAVAVPAETGGRVIMELLEDRYDEVDLRAHREQERRPTITADFIAELESSLTDRQATALRSAYYSGYYEDPRSTSGDELAAAMDVSRPTFHQHLRAAERKLLAAVLDRRT